MRANAVLLCALLCLAAVSAKDCGFPNGTATAVHHYNCDAGVTPAVTTALKVVNKAGQVVYPTHIYDLHVEQTLDNKGAQLDELLVDVSVLQYKSTLLKPECHWTALPTFGLTDNLDWCDLTAGACPLKQGINKFKYFLDLSKYKVIIDLLSESYTYELHFKMHTKDKKEIGCLAVQTKEVKD